MEARLATVAPPAGGLYRIARGAGPFVPPEWERALEDGTFGNRFDDPSADEGRPPEERFRAIYCATQRAATFGETLARIRPSPSLLVALEAIDDDEPLEDALAGVLDPEDMRPIDPADPRRGLVSADWRIRRRVGHTLLDPALTFVDITNAETMQCLRTELAPLAARLRLKDVDLAVLTSQERRFTQGCARYIYDQTNGAGAPLYAGIRYPSRVNEGWECWAVFVDRIRHAPGWPGHSTTVFPDDEDLLSVARLFNLTIEIFPGQGNYVRP